ncbi:MAG: DUF6173 family protein [Cypionkella sp.]|nr:DUF6173 family protein [Cypionkella sp.]
MPELPPSDAAQPDQMSIGPAQSAYLRIIQHIRAFEAQLDAGQEVAMGFAGSDAGILRIEGIGFFDPDLITFYGRDEAGQKTQLIQHVSQLSVLLRAAPVANLDTPARRIGFELKAGWLGGEAGDGSA